MKCFTYWLCFVHDQMNYSRNNVLGTWKNVFIISHYSRRFWSDFLVLQWILLPFIIEFTLPSLMIHMFVYFKGLHPNHTCRSYTPRFDLFFSTLTHVILYFNFPWTLHKLEREIKFFIYIVPLKDKTWFHSLYCCGSDILLAKGKFWIQYHFAEISFTNLRQHHIPTLPLRTNKDFAFITVTALQPEQINGVYRRENHIC